MPINSTTYSGWTSWELPEFTQEKAGDLNSPKFIKAIDFVVKTFTTKKTLCPDGFTGKLYWTFKQELI